MTPLRLRRAAAAVLAATTSILPIALWSDPAAAAPPDLSLTGDGCAVTGSGEGYDELRLVLVRPTSSMGIAGSTGTTVTATYGQDWLVAQGDTVDIELEGYVDDLLVATETITVGACDTGGSALAITATDVGSPSDPAWSSYGLVIGPCGQLSMGVVTTVGAAAGAVVPVPAGTWCVRLGSFFVHVVGVTIDPRTVTVPAGQSVPVTVTGDWIGTRVSFVGPVPPAPDGQALLSWSSADSGNVIGAGECAGSGGSLECPGFPRLRPGGTIDVTSLVPGWTLQTTSFDETDCTLVTHDGRDWCELPLTFVSDGSGTPQPPPAPPGPQPDGPCASAPAIPFVDVAADSVHLPGVACAAWLGLVKGGPGGAPANVFGPTGSATRGQLASMVANLLTRAGVELPAGAPDAFADDDGDVHETSIDQLSALGIIGGNGEAASAYAPGRAATRSEVASFLRRAHDVVASIDLPPGPDAFVDDEGDPAEADIDALAAAGILAGKAPGVFDPAGTVTREQLATLFVRLVEHLAG